MDRFATTLAALGGRARFGAAVAAGGASALALAPLGLFPVLWLTVPAFVWLLDGAVGQAGPGRWRRFRSAAVAGWGFGFGYFLGGLWWIGAAFLVDGDQFAWLLPLAVTALPAGLALFWGLAAGLAALAWRPGWRRILVFAVAFAAIEWLRGHLLTGFPWNAFGYTLTPVPVMMQSAALVGLWGLTLAAFVIFAAPAALAPHGRSRGARLFVGAAALLLLAHAGYGLLRLAGAADEATDTPLRIVQPALEQSEKWQATNEDEIVARYLALSAAAGPGGAPGLGPRTVLVWPESAFPFLLSDRPDVVAAIGALLPPGAVLVTGAVRAANLADPRGEAFNSVLVIDDGGSISAAYDKVHLVPFGEYLPLRGLFDLLGIRQLVALPEGFTPGAARMMLTLPGAPPFAPLICYEIIFPGAAVPRGPRPGWILNLTNDAWFGATPGPYQHFEQSRIRAVEEGLPLVRAANSGISAIVDPYGRIRGSLRLGVAGTLDGALPRAVEPTPYARLGDLPFGVLLLACLGLAVTVRREPRDLRHN